jgi:hypothetical protein
MKYLHAVLLLVCLTLVTTANALDVLDYLTDKNGIYQGPTVEENVVKMDTDNNGFADVTEVRAFLEIKHGAGYQKAVLDRWEVLANSNSCGTSFTEALVE